jgi:beta-phosphoglucomutase
VIEAVIFDVDGVLVDSYAAHFESWKRLGRETGVTLTERQFAESFGRRSREVIRQHWGASLREAEVARLDRRKEALFREILEVDFPGMEGAAGLIVALAAAHIHIAVGSSAPKENVALVLDRLGVVDRIAAVVTGEDVTRGKPDPQVFQLAAKRLGSAPEACVVIEDAVPGVEAARAAGMKVVALVSTGRDAAALRAAGPDLVVHSLRELSPSRLGGL